TQYLGQERLDQHRRLQQVLESVEHCQFLKQSVVYVDDFLDFTDFERKMLAAIAKAGARIEITLLLDPHSPVLDSEHHQPDDLGLFHRTESAYRRLYFAFRQEGVEINPPVRLKTPRRFLAPELARLEREMFPGPGATDSHAPEPHEEDRNASAIDDQTRLAPVSFFEAPDARTEADVVAGEIRALLQQGFRLRDVAVLVRDLSKYHPLLSTSFDEHGIPFFVDRRRAAAHHPLPQFLRSILHIARFDWPHEAVMTLLKTGLAGVSNDEADELENYVLLHRVRGAKWESDEPWSWRRDLTLQREEDAASSPEFDPLRIDAIRRGVADKLAPLVGMLRFEKPVPLREVATEIFAVLERFGVRATLAKWMAESVAAAPSESASLPGSASALEQRDEHEQVWAGVVGLFEQMVDLLGDEPVTPENFSQIVDAGLEQFDLALTPPAVDQVLIGQADRTRSLRVRAVLVMGLNEGEFPATARDDTVFSDRERRELVSRKMELDPGARRRLLDERLLGYIACTQASQRLILTRPLADGTNRRVTPSQFWLRIRELFPDAPIRVLPRQHTDDISRIATPRQLVTGLMRWVLSQGAPSDENPVARPGAAVPQDSVDPWPFLYQWLARDELHGKAIDLLRESAWPALGYFNDAALLPGVRESLFHQPLSVDVAQLETFAACPFRHFARYGLRLRPREGEGVGAQDLGRIYHQLLEKLVGQAAANRVEGEPDALPITREMIRSAAQTAGRALRGEIMLGSARNRYLLGRIERTLEQVIATQREMMRRSRFRPAHVGVTFGEDGKLPALQVVTPKGEQVSVHGKIDRVDSMPADGQFAVFDYKLSVQPLSMQKVYHGLTLQLLAQLLALQAGGENLAGRALAPAGAFYLQLLRYFNDLDHPDEALDPSDPRFLLAHKPRGVFHASALEHFDSQCAEGHSLVVQAYLKKDGSFGYRDSTDVTAAEEFHALLLHVRRRMGEIADQVLAGTIDINPSRLNRESPCPRCEFRGVCRFETTVNTYRILDPMKRDEVLVKLREEAALVR
ncbi:MAG: ATP-dependent deoxyribonuclease subunit, partial [Phycisphaerales bacterium]|nr:ATP-dependent deoxyribonuclease subunit [Phycisphaerales bacterium]